MHIAIAVYHFAKREGWGIASWILFVWGIPGLFDDANTWRRWFDQAPDWVASVIWAAALFFATLWVMFKVDGLLCRQSTKISLLSVLIKLSDKYPLGQFSRAAYANHFRQFALNGEIVIHGRAGVNEPVVIPIPSGYWNAGAVDTLALYANPAEAKTEHRPNMDSWYNLHVSKGDVHKFYKHRRAGAL